MPLILDDDSAALDVTNLDFRKYLRKGEVVPIVSNRAIFDLVLGGYERFLSMYAGHTRYPLGQPNQADRHLAQMVKYYKFGPNRKPLTDRALKFDYLNYVKNYLYKVAKEDGVPNTVLMEVEEACDSVTVTEFAHRLGYPRRAGSHDPLMRLANQPFKVIITTSYFSFIEDALRQAQKSPKTEVCRWKQTLTEKIPTAINDHYEPNAQEPLVYHLLGLDEYEESLVLSEDDYLEYLGNLCQHQNHESTDYVPALVRKALRDDLVVLGFSLDSWAFRVLYAGLIKRSGRDMDRGRCVIQLPNSEEEKAFLEGYVENEAKFKVWWGSLDEFAQKEFSYP